MGETLEFLHNSLLALGWKSDPNYQGREGYYVREFTSDHPGDTSRHLVFLRRHSDGWRWSWYRLHGDGGRLNIGNGRPWARCAEALDELWRSVAGYWDLYWLEQVQKAERLMAGGK